MLAPFLLAVFSVLSLLASNWGQVDAWQAVRRLLPGMLLLALALLLVIRLLVRDWRKAALLASLFLVLFISYGHIYQALTNVEILGAMIRRHRILAPVFAVMGILLAWLIWRQKTISRNFTTAVNLAVLVLVLMQVGQIGVLSVRNASASAEKGQNRLEWTVAPNRGNTPDVYYIILDGHVRQDMLQTEFDLDNSAFIQKLRNMGFFVADCAMSNYAQTELSLASSLNYSYLQTLDSTLDPNSNDKSDEWALTRESAVLSNFKQLGYTTITFDTGFNWANLTKADIYFSPASENQSTIVTPFESMYLRSTAALIFLDANTLSGEDLTQRVNAPNGEYIQRIRFTLNKLNEIAAYPSPKFVMAHLVIPHYPFVFNPDGSLQEDVHFYMNAGLPVNGEYETEGYRNQVQFIDTQIVGILQQILDKSKTPPIIILQGDHGWGGDSRMTILSAYYLPGENAVQQLYPDITPVNSFRVVFNQYFGADLPLLPDESYLSSYDLPFKFSEVSDPSPLCLN
ncbi:MAG: hypothetical protein ABFD44_10680 [Anaerolineaceae bacterium]